MPALATMAARSALVVAGVVAALVATVVAHGWDGALLVPDLVAALAFIVLGARAWPDARPTFWLALTFTVAWIAGTLVAYGLYWHRGFLVHLLLSFPRVWPGRRLRRLAIIGGYAASVTPFVWSSDAASVVLAAALASVAASSLRDRPGRAARWCSLAFAVVVAVGSVIRSVVPQGRAVEPVFWAYALVITATAVVLGLGLRRADAARVADLVVELGGLTGPDAAPAAVARSLSDVLGDSITRDDPIVARTVDIARQMTATHRTLEDETRRRISEVEASRRRLLAAGDDERRHLQERLHQQVIEPLGELERLIRGIQPGAGASLDGAGALVRRAIDEVGETAAGLGPRALEAGLEAALRPLTVGGPVPVHLSIVAERFAPEIEAAAYYVCAESLVNAFKHAAATAVVIVARRNGSRLEVSVSDDGGGGADLDAGSGLRGLRDRVDSLGGEVEIMSPPGAGTTVRAWMPVS